MTARRGLAAALLVVAGGLALTGSATASWVTAERVVEIGGVPLEEVTAHEGTAFAPLVIVWGVAGAVAGIALAGARGRARRVLGGVVAVIGLVAAADVTRGAVEVARAGGGLEAGPGVGVAGAVAVTLGGALALRGDVAPRLPSRFDIDRARPADEWGLTDDEGDPGPIEDRGPGGDPGPIEDRGPGGDPGPIEDRGPAVNPGPIEDRGPAVNPGPIEDRGPGGEDGGSSR